MRAKVDDLLLMGSKNAENPTRGEQCQMSERAKGAIAEQNIARLQGGMNLADARQIVRTQGSSGHVQQQTAARMKERQEVHHGKSAAGLLSARLAEFFLQRLGVGHRDA
jgi:hypothetical protein